MNYALDLIHKPKEAGGGYEPVEKHLMVKKSEGKLVKKTIYNKLGQKKILFVKDNSNE